MRVANQAQTKSGWLRRLWKLETLALVATLLTSVIVTSAVVASVKLFLLVDDFPPGYTESKDKQGQDNQVNHTLEALLFDTLEWIVAVANVLLQHHKWLIISTILQGCSSTVMALLTVRNIMNADKGKTSLFMRLRVALHRSLQLSMLLALVAAIIIVRDLLHENPKLSTLSLPHSQSKLKYDWLLVPLVASVSSLNISVILGVLCDGITDALYFRKLVNAYLALLKIPKNPTSSSSTNRTPSPNASPLSKSTSSLEIAISTSNDNPHLEHDIVSALLSVLDYAAYTNRRRDYARFAKILCDYLVGMKQYTEAGHVCWMHASLLDWQEVPFIEEQLQLDYSKEEDPKVTLLNMALQNFIQANDWEICLDIISELKYYYRHYFFDLDKYNELLQKEEELTNKILKADRAPPVYYVVIYYGSEMPSSMQNKAFIYKEHAATKLPAFVAKIQASFPGIKILDKEPKSEHVSETKACFISGVVPARPEELQSLKIAYPRNWPQNIRMWFQYKNVNIFCRSEVFIKESDPQQNQNGTPSTNTNQFASLWTRNRYFTTDIKFPGVRRVARVITSNEVLISPIDNAINNISKKNEEMAMLLQQAQTPEFKNDPKKVNSLTMALTGTLMAGVNGGLDMYKSAFLSDNNRRRSWQERKKCNKLISVIRDHIAITEACLRHHKTIISTPAQQKLQDKLEESLVQMKQRFARELRTWKLVRVLFGLIGSIAIGLLAVALALYVPREVLWSSCTLAWNTFWQVLSTIYSLVD